MDGSRSETNSPALSVGQNSKGLAGCMGGLFAVLFCGAFLLAGLGVLFGTALWPMWKIWQAVSWPQVPCTILDSDVVASGDGDTFHIKVSYSYEFNSQQYTGTRYSFSNVSTSGRAGKQKIVDGLPKGHQTVCYYNPSNPEESVLNRGFVPEMWWGLFSLPFIGIGMGGFWVVSRMRRSNRPPYPQALSTGGESGGERKRAGPMNPSAARIYAWSDSDFDEEDLEIPDGPVTLKPENGPVGQFVGCLVVSIIVHVFIGIFYAARFEEWSKGQWDWWPDIFAIPAALISLTCILGVIHAFLGMFNPKPILTLSRQAIPLGGRVRLQWEFDGSPSSIRSLTFKLEGVEEARYQRGTDTHTDTEEFYQETISSTYDPLEIANGDTEIVIPSDTMHSFLGTNNKIKWRLTLRGEIPFWPDVTANFPIRILPHEPVA